MFEVAWMFMACSGVSLFPVRYLAQSSITQMPRGGSSIFRTGSRKQHQW